jgi:Tat protein secretion system quality control protein TatD with DNase activity
MKNITALERILRDMAPLLHGRPVVLHLRDQEAPRRLADPPSKGHDDILALLLKLVRERVLRDDQAFQLHCFQGPQSLVERWLASFPRTHFTVGGAVEQFGARLQQGLCAIPLDRLLLETDAPHLVMRAAGGREFSTPNDVHLVGAEVAHLRNQSLPELLEACNYNAVSLFGLQ